MKMTVGNKLHITGSITDENNTPVTGSTCTLKINNTTENVTLTNGTVDIDKTMDTVGDYDVGIGYDGVESTVTSVTVLKAEPSIGVTGYTDTTSSSDPLNITATLLDNKGNPIKGASVRFKDLTTDYGTSTTGDDGKCGFTASNLTLGYHRFKVIYDGNDLYWATRTGFDVNVIKTKNNSSLSISLSSNSVSLGESVTVTGTLTGEDGSAISGATVELMVGSVDSSITNYATISTDITNNDGTCTFTYTPDTAGSSSIKLSYDGSETYNGSVSGIVDLTVINPTIFEDTCTSDNTAQYTSIKIVKNSTVTLTYDTDHYKITGSGNYVAGYNIPNTDNIDNMETDMTIKNIVNSAYNQLWFGLMDTDTGEDYMFRLRGDKLFQTELINTTYSHESGEDIVTNISDITTSKHTIKLVKKGTSFTGTLLNSNGEVLGSKELTLPSISNYKYVFGVWCEKGTSTSEVDIYSIKAVQL